LHRFTDFQTAVEATQLVSGLNKSTGTAYSALNWESEAFSVGKNAFTTVINFKCGIAMTAPGNPWIGLNEPVLAKWAG